MELFDESSLSDNKEGMNSFKPKPILNKSDLRQIKKSRTKIGGNKVITDDVKKLKSLKVTPDIPEYEKIHYYKEPIWIEYYIPKESRFALETKYLFIKLIDPIPRENRDEILRKAQEENKFINLLEHMKGDSPSADQIRRSYKNFESILETTNDQLEKFDINNNYEYLKTSIYLTESLMSYEPTLATLEYLGDYSIHNLNWLIRKLNEGNVEFSLEDRTILLLIKRRNDYWTENNLPEDDEFDLFSALFYEQAYPHRGAEELEKEDFL
jgi:hypothetical protein